MSTPPLSILQCQQKIDRVEAVIQQTKDKLDKLEQRIDFVNDEWKQTPSEINRTELKELQARLARREGTVDTQQYEQTTVHVLTWLKWFVDVADALRHAKEQLREENLLLMKGTGIGTQCAASLCVSIAL